MVSRKTSQTASRQRHRRIVKEIERKFGKVIDLEHTPFVLVEIIQQFGHRFDEGSSGTGGVSPGVSTVAVGITPPPPPPPPPTEGLENTFLAQAILTMQRDIKALSRKMDRLAPSK